MSLRPPQVLRIDQRYIRRVLNHSLQAVTFTTITSRHAKKINRSPTVRNLERAKNKGALSTPQQNATPHWPLGLFDEAHRSTALAIPSTTAVQVLNHFQALGRRPSQQAIQQLCTDLDIKPVTLSILARILLRSGYPPHSTTARDLFVAASKQNEETATAQLIQQAIKADQLQHPDLGHARQHLDYLAAASNPTALLLLGTIRENEGNVAKALALYNQACSTANNIPETSNGLIAKALNNAARLYQRLGDTSSAKAALEKAALSHDNPHACFHLALHHISLTSPNYLPYMLKAAASGVSAAAQELGLFYLAQSFGMLSLADPLDTNHKDVTSSANKGIITDLPPLLTVAQKRAWATEWFTVSATASSRPMSQLCLAILLRAADDHQKALQWLNQAGKDPEWAEMVESYREQWYNKDYDFLMGDHTEAGEKIERVNGLRRLLSEWAEKGTEKGQAGGD